MRKIILPVLTLILLLALAGTAGADTVIDQCTVLDDNYNLGGAEIWQRLGQSYTSNGYNITKVTIGGRKVGSPTGTAYIKIYAHSGTYGTTSVPTGAAIGTLSFDVSAWGADFADFTYTFSSSIPNTNGVYYVFTVEYSGGDSSNYLQVGISDASQASGNMSAYNGGWSNVSPHDIYFKLYGVAATNPPTVTTTTTSFTPASPSRNTTTGVITSPTTATGAGIITTENGTISAYGVCIKPYTGVGDLASPPTTADTVFSGTGGDTFTAAITGLTLTGNAQYMARAYATNETGTGYGATIVFPNNYYFDSTIAGDGSDGAVNDVTKPRKTTAQLNDLFQAKTPIQGDRFLFRMATVKGQQVFNGTMNFGYYDTGPPPNDWTFGTYGADGSHTAKPILTYMTLLTSWTQVESTDVYYATVTADKTAFFEDYVMLVKDTTTACAAAGSCFWDTGTNRLYYHPTTGTPAAHAVGYAAGIIVYASNSTGHTWNGLYFVGSGDNYSYVNFAANGSPGVNNITIENCYFYGATLHILADGDTRTNVIGTIIKNNTLDHCFKNSICVPNAGSVGGNGSAAGHHNMYIGNNLIKDHNTDGNGNMADTISDDDGIYGQSWMTVKCEHNEVYGFTGNAANGIFSNAIQDFTGPDNNGRAVIGGFSSGTGGVIRIAATKQGGGDLIITGAGLLVGDSVWVYGVTGTSAPAGRYKVSAVDTAYIELEGTTYAAGWSGGAFYHCLPFGKKLTINANYLHDCSNGIHQSGGGFISSDDVVKIYDNIIVNMGLDLGSDGIFGICTTVTNDPAGGSLIANNTIKLSAGQALRMDGGANYLVKNNISAGTPDLHVWDSNAGVNGTNTYDYNDYQGAGSGTPFKWGAWAAANKSLADWKTAAGNETNSITGNPLFTNAGGSFALATDFQLGGSSPCINTGDPTALPPTDYNGFTWITNDIGAWANENFPTITGTVSGTLAPAVGSLAGSPTVSGAITGTLTAVTGSLAGTPTVSGVLAGTLSPITGSFYGYQTTVSFPVAVAHTYQERKKNLIKIKIKQGVTK